MSSESFETVVARIEREIDRPPMSEFWKKIAAAATMGDLEVVVGGAVGSSGLLEFARFDIGGILRKEPGTEACRGVRLVIGNPIIMKEMAKPVPDAGSYAPVTVLIDSRSDGAHLSYDRMASLFASYGSSEALKVARDLDAKIEALLTRAASSRRFYLIRSASLGRFLQCATFPIPFAGEATPNAKLCSA